MNDLISRSRVIREILGGVIEVTTPDNDRRPQEAVEDYRAVIIKYLVNVPAVDPVMLEDMWKPVSSGELPETSDYVLCCTITQKGVKSIVRGYYDPALERWCCGMNSNVIAWMNMPPEYKGE